jgi:hypothetical protein
MVEGEIDYSIGTISNPPQLCSADLLIYCIGFETRSGYLVSSGCCTYQKHLAIVYRDRQVMAFTENHERAKDHGHSFTSDELQSVAVQIRKEITALQSAGSFIRVAIDVSSMDRGVMSQAIITTLESLNDGDTLLILYVPSKFEEGWEKAASHLLPIRRFGVAHRQLAGRIGEPRPRTSLIIGLGFEYGVALNTLEDHDPDTAFIFAPVGFDSRFDDAVRRANFGFDFGPREFEIIPYRLDDIGTAFDTLASLVNSMRHNTNIMCVPFGPKIFSAALIVLSYIYKPELTLLRYSLVADEDIQDIKADERIVGLSVSKVVRTVA